MICGFSPLFRGFPAVRRGIGHLVPILGGRQLAVLVRGGEGACPSGGCQVGMAGQLVGPAPAPHGALSGRQASAGYGPASDVSASAQPVRRSYEGLVAPSRYDLPVMRCSCRELKLLSVASALGVSVQLACNNVIIT